MSDIISSGNKQDKWILKVTDLLNWLNENKSAVLVAGDNITLEPQSDGTIEISASGGGGDGDVTDVQLDGTSILDQDGIANITSMSGATAQANGAKGLVPTPLIADKDKFLKGDGTWANASNVGALNDLSDVNISSPTDGQALKYDATNQRWINDNVGENNVDDVEVNGVSVVDSNKIAQIISYKEVTQQEYDLLSQEEKMNGVAYFIKDAGLPDRTSIYSPIIYSLDERCIGVYVDGKPLYQKSYIVTPTASSGSFDITTLYVDKLIYCSGAFTRNGVQMKELSFRTETPSYNNYYVCAELNTQSNLLTWGIGGYSYSEINEIRITIQYTKTTDVAGQGNWGQDGIPTVHFDGNEKVIGTWFGETLYQKTCQFTCQTNSTKYELPEDVVIHNIFGTISDNNDRQCIHVGFNGGTVDFVRVYQEYEGGTNGIHIQNSYFASRPKASITIQYTKASS